MNEELFLRNREWTQINANLGIEEEVKGRGGSTTAASFGLFEGRVEEMVFGHSQ